MREQRAAGWAWSQPGVPQAPPSHLQVSPSAASSLAGLKAYLLPLAELGQKNEKSPLALHSAGKRPSWGWGWGSVRKGGGGEISGWVGHGPGCIQLGVPLPRPSRADPGFKARIQEPEALAPSPVVPGPSRSMEWVPDGARSRSLSS